jgi:hypothetical protein
MSVIKSASFVWLVAFVLLLSACEGLHAQARETMGLQTYVGDGFSLQHPANAQVEDVVSYPYHIILVPRDQLPMAPGTIWAVYDAEGSLLVETRYP